LGLVLLSVLAVRGDHLDTLLGERFVEQFGVVGLVPDQPFGLLGDEPAVQYIPTRVTSCWLALVAYTETGRLEQSASAVSFLPLPRLVFPTARPPFWRPRT